MKFFCFNVLFIAVCLVCEVISDYSELMLPSKDRTMRLNMRVGKRFDDANDEEDAVNKRELPNPKRRLRLVFRPGKRNYDNPEQTQFYANPHQGESLEDRFMKAPKRKLRVQMRTGKRNFKFTDQDNTFTPLSQFDTEPHYHELAEPFTDPKRSSSHFLMYPRVGKNDRNWKLRPLINLQKRSDPKATDLWFGPRLGRANDEEFQPWNYIILNGNDVPKVPVFKSSLDDQPIEDTAN